MIDREKLRADAERLRGEAKQLAQKARADAEDEKRLARNPNPNYVKMPDPTGNAEKDSEAELSALQKGFRERAKDEARRFELATDSEYWVCFCFQDREQKEAFLGALKLLKFGDKYIDGQRAAKELGIKLPKSDILYNTSEGKADPKWLEFVKK